MNHPRAEMEEGLPTIACVHHSGYVFDVVHHNGVSLLPAGSKKIGRTIAGEDKGMTTTTISISTRENLPPRNTGFRRLKVGGEGGKVQLNPA